MKSSLALVRIISALAAGLALSARAGTSYTQMVVFGDSLSDNGNLAAVAGSSALTMLDYDPFRITDGPTTTPPSAITGVAVEQLNSALGLPTLTPALLGGTNYAWAYATTGYNGLNVMAGVTPGTGAQVASYLSTNLQASPTSLYVMWAGSNDLLDATTPAGIAAAEATAIANLDNQLFALLSAGARNILWFDIPDLALTPEASLLSAQIQQQLQISSAQFRTDWLASIAQLDALFPTATITGFDDYTLLNAISNQPGNYGLANATLPAQGMNVNPDTFLFWDGLHPTTKADSIVANAAFQQLQPVPEPATYGLAGAAALSAVAFLRRRRAKSSE